jgi:hypothetical protein
MKINGQELNGPNVEVVVLPRGDGNNIVLHCRALPDFEEFEVLCPSPKAPMMLVKNQQVPDFKDKTYREIMERRDEQRIAFMVLKSLEETNIEWDTVDMDDPATWTNYVKDFKAAGLNEVEINRIVVGVMQANALDERKLEQARAVFQLGQRLAASESSGQSTEQESS